MTDFFIKINRKIQQTFKKRHFQSQVCLFGNLPLNSRISIRINHILILTIDSYILQINISSHILRVIICYRISNTIIPDLTIRSTHFQEREPMSGSISNKRLFGQHIRKTYGREEAKTIVFCKTLGTIVSKTSFQIITFFISIRKSHRKSHITIFYSRK